MTDSPRLRALRDDVRRRGAQAVTEFWDELDERGTPLVEPVPGRPELRLVTLVWRGAESPAGVYALVNRLTDKERVGAGMMSRIPDTDVWHVGIEMPVSLRATYRIYPFTEGDRFFGSGVPEYLSGKDIGALALSDPRNLRCRDCGGTGFGSVVELEQAPPTTEWSARHRPPAGHLSSTTFTSASGVDCHVRQYIPGTPTPPGGFGMLIVFDGQRWFDEYHLPAAIDAAAAAGRIAPMGVLGIDSPPTARERTAQLAANREFLTMLAEELLPAVQASENRWAGAEKRILCGQSLGGLSALAAVLWTPRAYGAVIAQSPSVWWRPDGSGHPDAFDGIDSWLLEQFRYAAPVPLPIRLDVGSNEGTMAKHLPLLQEVLAQRGFRSNLRTFTGGHDFACWAAAMMDGLADLHTRGEGSAR